MDHILIFFIGLLFGCVVGCIWGVVIKIKQYRCEHENVNYICNNERQHVAVHCLDCGKIETYQMGEKVVKIFKAFTGATVKVARVLNVDKNKVELVIDYIVSADKS